MPLLKLAIPEREFSGSWPNSGGRSRWSFLKAGDVQAVAERKEEYFLEMIDEVKPLEAVVQFARRWHGAKPLAVASGGFHRQVERTLDALKIRSLFSAVVCLVFEDSPLGIQAAAAAGMQSVMVSRTGS